jgi:hypothetical protein
MFIFVNQDRTILQNADVSCRPQRRFYGLSAVVFPIFQNLCLELLERYKFYLERLKIVDARECFAV